MAEAVKEWKQLKESGELDKEDMDGAQEEMFLDESKVRSGLKDCAAC